MLKKRIPTILGIFLLLVGITAGVYLVELGPQSLSTRARPEVTPSEMRISDLTDSSFVISYRTEAEVIGLVHYGTSATNLSLSTLDDRDQSENSGVEGRKYSLHYFTIHSLKPETTYYFEISSGLESTIFNSDGKPFTVTTAASINPSAFADTSYGSVYYPDLSPVSGALVYVTLEGGSLLSSLTGASGTWAVPLSASLDKDLASFLTYDKEKALVTIEVIGPEGSVATAKTLTENDAPVEDIVLGEVYDFTSQSNRKNEGGETTGQPGGFAVEELFDLDSVSTTTVTVNNLEEGEPVNSQVPEFIGDGPPGAKLEILVESDEPITSQVTVNQEGSWSWSPTTPLDPGEHTLTIKWVDESGIVRLIRKSFVVYAQGESDLPAFEATPSAGTTPTPTSTVTPTSTPTPTKTTTPSPTPKPTKTPTPTTVPTLKATPAAGATEPGLPVPGGEIYSLGILLGGLIFVSLGAYLLLRKQTSN